MECVFQLFVVVLLAIVSAAFFVAYLHVLTAISRRTRPAHPWVELLHRATQNQEEMERVYCVLETALQTLQEDAVRITPEVADNGMVRSHLTLMPLCDGTWQVTVTYRNPEEQGPLVPVTLEELKAQLGDGCSLPPPARFNAEGGFTPSDN